MSDVKKRGRKPNGGKIVQQVNDVNVQTNPIPNIILHLKCISSDLYANVETYDSFQPDLQLQYEPVKTAVKPVYNDEFDIKTNDSACFWCTCSYSGQTAHIPKCLVNDVHQVYGCFCSPECATAFLFNENIDSSIKFERYYLLNRIYGTPTSNIKPAPAPFYKLNKFCGRLSIDEYRAQFKSDRTRHIDANMKRVAMNVYEEKGMDETTTNNEPTTRVMKRSGKKPNKAALLNSAFGK